MEARKQIDNKEKKVQKQRGKSTYQLLSLIDTNELIFQQLKQQLMGQLTSYQLAFSRQQNKYIQDRDFDHFKQCSDRFKRKGKNFIDRLSQIKNNCTKVIKNLPNQEKIIPSQSNNCFDMFVNEQVQSTMEFKVKNIQYENKAQKPFQNQFDSFLE